MIYNEILTAPLCSEVIAFVKWTIIFSVYFLDFILTFMEDKTYAKCAT